MVKRVEHDICDRRNKCPQQVLRTTAALLPTPLGPSGEMVSAVSLDSKLFHVLCHTRAILQATDLDESLTSLLRGRFRFEGKHIDSLFRKPGTITDISKTVPRSIP